MAGFDAAKRLAEARALLNKAKQYPVLDGLPKMTKNKQSRHNLAHQAVVLLIGPLRYTELAGALTKEERAQYEAMLCEAKQVRGY